MALLNLEDAKKHCRITIDVDDVYIENVILPAAIIRVQNRIKRNIYETQEALDSSNDETGIVADEALKIVMYMFVYDLYENRQTQETESFYFNSAVKEMLASYVNHL